MYSINGNVHIQDFNSVACSMNKKLLTTGPYDDTIVHRIYTTFGPMVDAGRGPVMEVVVVVRSLVFK
jgi:hypothetical protein